MSLLRALIEEAGSMSQTIRPVIDSSEKYILLFCVSVCQQQNIIYSWGVCLVLVCDVTQQNPTVFSNSCSKIALLVKPLNHLTTLKRSERMRKHYGRVTQTSRCEPM